MGGYAGPAGNIPSSMFPSLYEDILWRTYRSGHEERNARTGHVVRVYPHGPLSFAIDLGEDELLPVVGNRKLFPATAAAEVAWMLMGTQNAEFMLKHAKVVWEKFVEPIHLADKIGDGGRSVDIMGVKAAYGYRWRRHFKRDQLGQALSALVANPTDRRIWVSAWDPALDGLGAQGQVNVPCPVGFTLSIVDGRLCSALMLRSSDLFVGLPYDVMGHAMLMAVLATSLRLKLGTMHFTLAHPHLYDSHFEFVDYSLRQASRRAKVPLLGWELSRVEADPEGFVGAYKAHSQDAKWSDYCPRPDVIP